MTKERTPSFAERQLNKLSRKLGSYKWFNSFERAVEHFMESNILTYSKICEIGGFGTAGYGLGRLIAASTPEEVGHGLVWLVTGGAVALVGGAVDLTNWYCLRERVTNSVG